MKKIILACTVFFFLAILIFLFMKQQKQQQNESFTSNFTDVQHDISKFSIVITAVIESVLDKPFSLNTNTASFQTYMKNVSGDYGAMIDHFFPEAPVNSSMDTFLRAQRNYWNSIRSSMYSSIQTNKVTNANAFMIFREAIESVNLMDFYTDNLVYGAVNNFLFNNSDPLYENPNMFAADFYNTLANELSTTLIDQLFPTPSDDTPCNAFFLQIKNKVRAAIDQFNAIGVSNEDNYYKNIKYNVYLQGQKHNIPEGGYGYYLSADEPSRVCSNGYQSYPSDHLEGSVHTFVCN